MSNPIKSSFLWWHSPEGRSQKHRSQKHRCGTREEKVRGLDGFAQGSKYKYVCFCFLRKSFSITLKRNIRETKSHPPAEGGGLPPTLQGCTNLADSKNTFSCLSLNSPGRQRSLLLWQIQSRAKAPASILMMSDDLGVQRRRGSKD